MMEAIAATQADPAQAARQARSQGNSGELTRLSEQARDGNLSEDQIRAAAEKYEGFFVGKFVSLMYETVPVNDMFGGGQGEETFRQLLAQEYGDKIAQDGGFGLADQMTRSMMLKAQEGEV